VYETRE
jgi:hypothetical protein